MQPWLILGFISMAGSPVRRLDQDHPMAYYHLNTITSNIIFLLESWHLYGTRSRRVHKWSFVWWGGVGGSEGLPWIIQEQLALCRLINEPFCHRNILTSYPTIYTCFPFHWKCLQINKRRALTKCVQYPEFGLIWRKHLRSIIVLTEKSCKPVIGLSPDSVLYSIQSILNVV